MLLLIPSLATGRQGGPAVFDPLSIAGCKLWLKADSLVLSDGTAVSTWADQSGTANNGTQGTGANQPIYHTNIINGLPAVQFDGAAQFMNLSNSVIGVPLSAFAVVRPTVAGGSQSAYATIIVSNGGTGVFLVAALSTSSWGTFTNADLAAGVTLSANTNYLLENTAASNSTFLYQRGVQKNTSAVTEAGSGQSAIGDDPTNASRFYKGYIAEVIVYDTVLSSANRILVENGMIAKYAL